MLNFFFKYFLELYTIKVVHACEKYYARTFLLQNNVSIIIELLVSRTILTAHAIFHNSNFEPHWKLLKLLFDHIYKILGLQIGVQSRCKGTRSDPWIFL